MKETLEQFICRNHMPRTTEGYLYYINIFLQKNPNAQQYQYKDIMNYLAAEKENNRSKASLGSILTATKRYYDYLIDIGVREDHPCRNIKTTTIYTKQIQLQDLFSSAELEELLKRESGHFYFKQRNLVLISLFIYQGLTSAELLNVSLNDLNLDEGTVYIKPYNKRKARTLDLRSKQISFIERYLKESRLEMLKGRSTNKLLITINGAPLSVHGAAIVFNSLKLLFPGRSLCPLKIRMSVISNLLNEKKWALEDVQLFAGHAWPSTTELFLRQDVTQKRELINKFHPLK